MLSLKNYLTVTLPICILILLPTSSFAGDAEKGKAQFATLCASCHGEKGDGAGAAAAAFPADQKPRNLASGELKFAKDEAKFKELLQKGGGAVGLSMLMPPQPGLTEEELGNLYAFIQTLHKK